MYMTLVLLVVLLMAMLALFGDPHLSQSMNHMSFPPSNHKLDSFFHHVQLTAKMYSINFFYLGNHLLHVITILMSMPIDLTYAAPWYTSATQWVQGS